MIAKQKLPLIRAILLATALSTTIMAPAAFAETVEVSILNTRGADGIYRPALRVLRGGTVTFFNSGDAGLTEDIIRDGGALNEWLGTNVPAGEGAEPVSFVVTKIESRPPVVKEEEPPVEEPTGEEPTGFKDCIATKGTEEACDMAEGYTYCSNTFDDWPIRIAGFIPSTPKEFCYGPD